MIGLLKIHPSDRERIVSKILGGAEVHGNFLVSVDNDFRYSEELLGDNPNPRPKVSKLIRIEILEKALAEKGLPAFVRNVGKYTVDMIECVADLKAAKKLRKSPSAHIPRLLKLLDDALTHEDWSAIDDFVLAWDKCKIIPRNVIYQGQDYPYNEQQGEDNCDDEQECQDNSYNEEQGNKKRSVLSWIIVDSIRQLQRDLGRIPFRSEIMELVTSAYKDGIDEAELSRQLKGMKLSHLLPKKTKAAIEDAKNWDKDWDVDLHREWDAPWDA